MKRDVMVRYGLCNNCDHWDVWKCTKRKCSFRFAPTLLDHDVDITYLDDDDGSGSCVSCEHNIRVEAEDKTRQCFCEMDGHRIGYCQNWENTCKHHKIHKEAKQNDNNA